MTVREGRSLDEAIDIVRSVHPSLDRVAVRGLADRLRATGEPLHGPALFVCRHHVFGVGTFAVDAVLAGDALVQRVGESGAAAAVLVGTISSCHGAVNLLRIGAARAAEAAPALETI